MKRIISLWLVLFTISTANAGLGDLFIPRPKDGDVIGTIGQQRNKALPDTIEVLVWNAHKFDDENFWDEARMLAEDKHLVLFQEAMFGATHNQKLREQDHLSWTTATSFYVPTQNYQGTGVTSGTTAKTTERRYFKTVIKEPVISTPKVALITTHPLKDGSSLMVINIHAINFVTIFEFRFEMKRLYNAIKGHEGPMIFAGDFNTWAPVRQDILDDIANKLGLKAIQFPDGSRSTGLGRILDHALIRGFEVKEAHDYSWITTSDHKPLVFTLQRLRNSSL